MSEDVGTSEINTVDAIEDWSIEQAGEVTLKGLTALCDKLIHEREVKKKLEEGMKEVQEVISSLEMQILNIMKENALPNFKGAFGTISIKNNKSVTQPESLEEKLKLFEYLREQGIFEEMVAVNSKTLSSWASKEIEAKEKLGVFGWVPPGLKPATEYQSLSVRKK